MLCMTYFLTAISLEQQKLQKILDEFKHQIQNIQSDISTKVQDHYFHSLDVTIKSFYQVEKQCQARKVDMYLIPAIHNTAMPADHILDELESLKSNSMELFMEMQKQIEVCFDNGVLTMSELCNAMKQYCEIQQTILSKEETELMPMAQQALPFDVWFSISAKCLADQETVKGKEKSSINQNSEKKFQKISGKNIAIDKNKHSVQFASY
jgi:hemerythrin-like domain-containing protein